MNHNVGGYDRIARLVAGMAFLFVGIVGVGLGTTGALDLLASVQLAVALVLLLVGAVLVVTGYLRQCPINDRLGIDTQYVDRT